MKKDGNIGLSTYDALGILHDDIAALLKGRTYSNIQWDHVKDLFSHSSKHSTISWLSLTIIFFVGLLLILVSFLVEPSLEKGLFFEGILIIFIGVGNVFLALWNDRLRLSEIPAKINSLLLFIRECQEKCSWQPDNYPHLCSPYSPCITLQWTYRDYKLVNLPWALLVRGDTVLLRPGQPAPAASVPQEAGLPLECGEIYSPPEKHDNITQPTARTPLPNKKFILQETPLLRNIKEVLDNSERHPVSCYDKQRYLIAVTISLNLILPIISVCVLLVNSLRYVYIQEETVSSHWSVLFILQPATTVFPLLPLVLPLGWILLNTIGYAQISAYLQSSYTIESGDPFEEISIQEEGLEEVGVGLQWCHHLLHTLQGRQHFLGLTRTVNPLHVLGSVTALCCVDKKGILSWPNPTAEKVFFLRTAPVKPSVPSELGRSQGDGDVEAAVENDETNKEDKINEEGDGQELSTVSEVLDLTHDTQSPFKLYFDDTRWQEHMGSLKPIGLAILLNTCNMQTHQHYLQFCSHVTCEALNNEDLVPVTNRRCLCELSKQIGFTDGVLKNFKLLEQLSTFRHVQPETVRRDIKFARSLALATKLKLPFPHMVSVVTSEVSVPKSLQLFSQATGDIALDSCVDFWDGNTLRILTPSDRKKVLDFYQRTSLTAYCTAFGYRPLSRNVDHALTNVYMELPADSHNLYLSNRSPTPINPNLLSQSIDSLFGGEIFEEDAADIEACFDVQCNQIFLGMVTMQYQAKSEMVQLIEHLERACIRFVHFSKENELRSRVFSEKMGLESGWNCHISLLSSDANVEPSVVTEELEKEDEQSCYDAPLLAITKRGSLEGSKTMSASAPCAINMETGRTHKGSCTRSVEEEIECGSTLQDGWQSLSCLTDSTEQSAQINFDMSNRAKLPRGIDQIRPHLAQVDNVPLLVSLFTDCTPATTTQMIEIMQDFGEVVVVLGSSANADNCAIFLQANGSIAVEPLYPQVCQKVAVFRSTEDCVTPCHLGQRLNSLPCTVSITRQRPVSIFHLIMHSRHYMLCMWNSTQFWVCSSLAVSILQLICAILMLPPLFSIGQVLWLCCIVIPLISISLVFTPTSAKVMQRPGSKSHISINSETGLFVLWCYGFKLLPTLLIIPLVYTMTLSANCPSATLSATNGTCQPLFILPNQQKEWQSWQHYMQTFIATQHLAVTILVLHLVTMSLSFVYRDKLCWHKSPFHNKVWFGLSSSIVILQTVLFIFVFLPPREQGFSIPWYCCFISIVSPFIVISINETVKWQEIKANVRYEKRARLEFGTKLGMNSPF